MKYYYIAAFSSEKPYNLLVAVSWTRVAAKLKLSSTIQSSWDPYSCFFSSVKAFRSVADGLRTPSVLVMVSLRQHPTK